MAWESATGSNKVDFQSLIGLFEPSLTLRERQPPGPGADPRSRSERRCRIPEPPSAPGAPEPTAPFSPGPARWSPAAGGGH